MKYDFDVIVIGAGAAGLTSSIGLSKVGKKVLLVERDKMGGECTNTGCIPSKNLIHHARAFSDAKRLSGETDKLKLYKNRILSKVRDKITEIRSEESPELIQKKFGITVLLGEAGFQDSHTISVSQKDSEKIFTAKHIIISTGSSPRIMDIDGMDPSLILTNETLFSLDKIPGNLLIIGSGAIGIEMAEAFVQLGSHVSLLNRGSRILSREEPEISDAVLDQLIKKGVKVYMNSHIKTVEEQKFAIIEEKLDKKTIRYKTEFDKILIAIGRIPNIEGLSLENSDILYSEKGITVDRHYRTSKKNIFAIGDVSSSSKFTHVADDQGRHVVKKILLKIYRGKTNKPIPRVTFLNEEVASVGFTEASAREKFGSHNIRKIVLPYGDTDRARTDESRSGISIVIAKKISGKILGASLMGKNAGELISVFSLAIQNGISLYRINALVVPYPVLGSLYKKLSDTYIAETFQHLKTDLIYILKRQLPKLLAATFWIAILSYFFWYKSVNALSSLEIVKVLYDFVTNTTYGPVLYIFIYAIRPIVFFPATLLTLLSGLLFGFWVGVFYTVIGENLSANLAYAIGKYFSQWFFSAQKDGETGLLSSWARELRDNSFISVLIMRFIYLPFDLVNYGCGILKVRWSSYIIATLVGTLPSLMAFVSFGATIENIDTFDFSQISLNSSQLLISVLLFFSSLVIAKIIHNYQKNRQLLLQDS